VEVLVVVVYTNIVEVVVVDVVDVVLVVVHMMQPWQNHCPQATFKPPMLEQNCVRHVSCVDVVRDVAAVVVNVDVDVVDENGHGAQDLQNHILHASCQPPPIEPQMLSKH